MNSLKALKDLKDAKKKLESLKKVQTEAPTLNPNLIMKDNVFGQAAYEMLTSGKMSADMFLVRGYGSNGVHFDNNVETMRALGEFFIKSADYYQQEGARLTTIETLEAKIRELEKELGLTI